MVLPSVSLRLLDRRVRPHVPEQVRGAGGLGADDAQRGSLGEQAERAHDARRHADIDAAGHDGLLRLASPLRVEDLEGEPVLLEDADALAELGHGGVPVAALADGELQRVLRGGRQRAGRDRAEDGDDAAPSRPLGHVSSLIVIYLMISAAFLAISGGVL